jgi:plasmid rolling circle replication initiator protein Rep
MWMARFHQAAPALLAQQPKARFIFLTLTRKNMPITELRGALGEMSRAWGRLTKRKEFAAVLGWIRAVEVTPGAEPGSAHPHYHVLLIVPEDYFRRPEKWVTQAAWTAIWRHCLRLEYDPIVHVTAVKSKRAARGDGLPSAALIDAARETLKYAVKPADMAASPEWFLELTRQLHKLRFIASGGILKGVLREDDETNDDLLLLGDGETDEGPNLYFDWWRPVRRYKRRPRRIQ